MNPLHVIYRCPHKGCAHVQRVTFSTTGEVTERGYRGQSHRVTRSGFVVDHHFHPWTDWWKWMVEAGVRPCPTHPNQPLRARPVNGVLRPDHKCDARCESAKGPNCECACGGANHGAAHA